MRWKNEKKVWDGKNGHNFASSIRQKRNRNKKQKIKSNNKKIKKKQL
jgi:hypothetical protein